MVNNTVDVQVREHNRLKIILKIAIWIALSLGGTVLFLIGLNGKAHEAHQIGIDIYEVFIKLGEFFVLVFALHFLYDVIIKSTEHNDFIRDLKNVIAPQENDIKRLEQQIEDLRAQTLPILNISKYSDSFVFREKWKQIVEENPVLYLIGRFPMNLLEDRDIREHLVSERETNKKKINIFFSVEQREKNETIRILDLSEEENFSRIFLYHIDRLDWGFMLIGANESEDEVEILVNYSNHSTENQNIYYIFGESALSLMQSLKPRLSEISPNSSPYNTQWSVRIDNREVFDFITTKRFIYKEELFHLSTQGIPLDSEDKICKKMSDILKVTRCTLRVTHVAKKESIAMMKTQCFQEWLFENYEAAERGIEIKRIFIVPKSEITNNEIGNNELIDIMQRMKEKKIIVKWCILEEIDQSMHEDFSIYDEKHVVFIYQPYGGAWITHGTEARYSTDQRNIRRFTDIYNMIESQSRDFSALNQHHTVT